VKNIEMSIEVGNVLVIKVKLGEEQGPSKSGKTTIIATSEGNQPVPGREDMKIGLNIFKGK